MNIPSSPTFRIERNHKMNFRIKSMIAGLVMVIVIMMIYIGTLPTIQPKNDDPNLKWLQNIIDENVKKKLAMKNLYKTNKAIPGQSPSKSENDIFNFPTTTSYIALTSTLGSQQTESTTRKSSEMSKRPSYQAIVKDKLKNDELPINIFANLYSTTTTWNPFIQETALKTTFHPSIQTSKQTPSDAFIQTQLRKLNIPTFRETFRTTLTTTTPKKRNTVQYSELRKTLSKKYGDAFTSQLNSNTISGKYIADNKTSVDDNILKKIAFEDTVRNTANSKDVFAVNSDKESIKSRTSNEHVGQTGYHLTDVNSESKPSDMRNKALINPNYADNKEKVLKPHPVESSISSRKTNTDKLNNENSPEEDKVNGSPVDNKINKLFQNMKESLYLRPSDENHPKDAQIKLQTNNIINNFTGTRDSRLKICSNDNMVVKPKPGSCLPIQTLASIVNLCTHPLDQDSDVSGSLHQMASWEYNMMTDVQLAMLKKPSTGLIDVGAGIGPYTITAATYKRPVIAVEPYMPHVRLLQQSIVQNKLQDYVSLVCNAVSDIHETLEAAPVPGHITQVIWKYVPDTDNKTENKGENMVETITLDDLADAINLTSAVLKLDVPKYDHKILKKGYVLFRKVDIPYVFMHWSGREQLDLQEIAHFFVTLNYRPLERFNGKEVDIETLLHSDMQNVVWEKKKPK